MSSRRRSRSPRRDSYRERDRRDDRYYDRRDRDRDYDRRRAEEERARREAEREMMELERASRSVFITNLHIRANEKDLFMLFTQKAGRVLDVYIICDKTTNKSKGLAYVELESIDTMQQALGISGAELYGQAITVQPSQMEKNVQWTLQKKLGETIMPELAPHPSAPLRMPEAKVDISDLAAQLAAKLTETVPQSAMDPMSRHQQMEEQRLRKIYVGNLPRELNEHILKNMFEPFGTVEVVQCPKHQITGQCLGYAFITFRDKEAVVRAITGMNGQTVGEKQIKVNFVLPNGGKGEPTAGPAPFIPLPVPGFTAPNQQQQPQQPQDPYAAFNPQAIQYQAQQQAQLGMQGLPAAPAPGMTMEMERVDDDGGGMRVNASNRLALMQKLASASNVQIPLPPQLQAPPVHQAPAPQHPLAHVPGLLGPGSPIPTPCLLLKNMFDPREVNPAEPWEQEIMEDVTSEASRFGRVVHSYLDRNSNGYVYLRMDSPEAATQVSQLLNGRIYAGRPILVEYQFYPVYVNFFGQ